LQGRREGKKRIVKKKKKRAGTPRSRLLVETGIRSVCSGGEGRKTGRGKGKE